MVFSDVIVLRIFMFFMVSRWESEKPHQVSKAKAKGLGANFIPLEESLKDTIDCLKNKGFLNI